MEKNDNITSVIIFSGSTWEAGMVKSLLEDAGVDAYLNDEIRASNIPFIVDTGGFGAVKVVVSSNDLGLATLVVDEYKQNIQKG
jgi:hypothetical protein